MDNDFPTGPAPESKSDLKGWASRFLDGQSKGVAKAAKAGGGGVPVPPGITEDGNSDAAPAEDVKPLLKAHVDDLLAACESVDALTDMEPEPDVMALLSEQVEGFGEDVEKALSSFVDGRTVEEVKGDVGAILDPEGHADVDVARFAAWLYWAGVAATHEEPDGDEAPVAGADDAAALDEALA